MNAALRQALSPARCPSGGLRVSIEGEPCVLRCSGALWVLNHRILIAADLHLERPSPFCVPVLVQIGRERVGGGQAAEMILDASAYGFDEADLIAEVMGEAPAEAAE